MGKPGAGLPIPSSARTAGGPDRAGHL